MSTYVIGGGVAGLTYAAIDKSAIVLDKNPLGQLANKYILGPRLMIADLSTQNFFEELSKDFKLPRVEVTKLNIGFEDDRIVYSAATDDFKKAYSLITRGKQAYESSFLSEGRNSILHYVFMGIDEDNYSFLFNRIKNIISSRVWSSSVTKIDYENKLIHLEHDSLAKCEMDYDKLISTININLFNKLSNSNVEFDTSTKPKCFYITEYSEDNEELRARFGYVYSINGEYTRKTFQRNYVCYETVYPHEGDIINGCRIIQRVENIPIQIAHSQDVRKINDVYMLGRYAQWNHGIKFNNIIPIAKEIARLK